MVFGGLIERGRAEPDLFLLVRPWLLIALVFVARTVPLPGRAWLYAGALGLAAVAEALLLWKLGGGIDWRAGLVGLALGSGFAILCDMLVQAGRRLGGLPGAVAGALLAAGPAFALGPLDRLIEPRQPAAASDIRPPVALMTALPIIWGGGDIGAVLRGESESSAAYRWLDRFHSVTPIDSLSEASLAPHRLLLLAQPRALAPAELVALDAWARAGGRALILTDPLLVWETGLPLGDPRAPPPTGLLGPLLTHWGLTLDARPDAALVVEAMPDGSQLATAAPGRLGAGDRRCRVEADGLIARCRIGSGEATVVADADLLDDRLWAGEGEGARIADNMLLITRWLDGLGGVARGPVLAPIRWIAPGARLGPALGWGFAPIGLCLILGLMIRSRARVSRQI